MPTRIISVLPGMDTLAADIEELKAAISDLERDLGNEKDPQTQSYYEGGIAMAKGCLRRLQDLEARFPNRQSVETLEALATLTRQMHLNESARATAMDRGDDAEYDRLQAEQVANENAVAKLLSAVG